MGRGAFKKTVGRHSTSAGERLLAARDAVDNAGASRPTATAALARDEQLPGCDDAEARVGAQCQGLRSEEETHWSQPEVLESGDQSAGVEEQRVRLGRRGRGTSEKVDQSGEGGV